MAANSTDADDAPRYRAKSDGRDRVCAIAPERATPIAVSMTASAARAAARA